MFFNKKQNKEGGQQCMKFWLITGFLLLVHFTLVAQSETDQKKWLVKGYVKDLLSVNIADDSTLIDNLIHNRINFEWFPTNTFTAHLELRNRIFIGDLVREVPDYGELIDVNNDYLNLSCYAPKNKGWLFHTMIDRAYVEWIKGDWELRAGRQRINWGVNLVWNPNDLFNAYSFYDFDYEERPGSDAIRIKKYTGFASSIEIAGNINDDFDKMVMAGMWKINKRGYDIQFLAGKARRDITIGAGWAGNLGDAGFKGEITYFEPYGKAPATSSALLASVSADYSFENSLYIHGSVLFNSDGSDEQTFNGASFIGTSAPTTRNLSPFKYSTFLQVSYNFHPLITGGLAAIFFPGERNALFLNPNITFSLKPNLDLNLTSQLYYDQYNGNYQALARVIYTRLKWSF